MIHTFSGLNLLETRPWLNQETMVNIDTRTVFPVSDRQTKITRSIFINYRRAFSTVNEGC